MAGGLLPEAGEEGDGVGGLEGGDDPLGAGEELDGLDGLGVRDRAVLHAAAVLQVGVLRADAGVVETGADRVRDLDLPVEIVGAPTARAGDGLALSSRNAYLSETERARAGELNAILNALARAVEAGEPVPSALTEARNRAAGLFDATDYIELRDSETLAPLPEGPLTREARALAAVKLGGTRLIDNRAVAPPRG